MSTFKNGLFIFAGPSENSTRGAIRRIVLPHRYVAILESDSERMQDAAGTFHYHRQRALIYFLNHCTADLLFDWFRVTCFVELKL